MLLPRVSFPSLPLYAVHKLVKLYMNLFFQTEKACRSSRRGRFDRGHDRASQVCIMEKQRTASKDAGVGQNKLLNESSPTAHESNDGGCYIGRELESHADLLDGDAALVDYNNYSASTSLAQGYRLG